MYYCYGKGVHKSVLSREVVPFSECPFHCRYNIATVLKLILFIQMWTSVKSCSTMKESEEKLPIADTKVNFCNIFIVLFNMLPTVVTVEQAEATELVLEVKRELEVASKLLSLNLAQS